MAKAIVTCACGSTFVISEQNRKMADRKAAWMEEQGYLCPSCYEQKKEQEKQKNYKEDVALARDKWGLEPLRGTDKQVIWAEDLRLRIINNWNQERLALEKVIVTDGLDHSTAPLLPEIHIQNIDEFTCCMQAYEQYIHQQLDAHWWIEARSKNFYQILKGNIARIKQPEPIPMDIWDEATVRPPSTITETIVVIRILDQAIEVRFPEKREDFREILKSLGYRWVEDRWRRKILPTMGTVQDRAAELGNKLLRKGFIIQVLDPVVRENAINGKYALEQERWIKVMGKGSNLGWFAVVWQERSQALYDAARRLTRSRWDKDGKCVVVPPEQFEIVLDFAQMYKFSLTEKAQALVANARARKDAMICMQPQKVSTSIAPDAIPRVPLFLEVPAVVEIPDALQD